MTLFIAVLLLIQMHAEWWAYVLAIWLYAFHVGLRVR